MDNLFQVSNVDSSPLILGKTKVKLLSDADSVITMKCIAHVSVSDVIKIEGREEQIYKKALVIIENLDDEKVIISKKFKREDIKAFEICEISPTIISVSFYK